MKIFKNISWIGNYFIRVAEKCAFFNALAICIKVVTYSSAYQNLVWGMNG